MRIRPSLELHAPYERTAKRQVARNGRLDPGPRSQPLLELSDELETPLWCVVASLQVDRCLQQVARVQTDVGAQLVDDVARHQRGAGEQHEREGHLGNHERTRPAASESAARAPSTAVADRSREVEP